MTEVGISSIVGYIPKLRLLRKSVAEVKQKNLMLGLLQTLWGRAKELDRWQIGMKTA